MLKLLHCSWLKAGCYTWQRFRATRSRKVDRESLERFTFSREVQISIWWTKQQNTSRITTSLSYLTFFQVFTCSIPSNLTNIFKTVCNVGQNKEKWRWQLKFGWSTTLICSETHLKINTIPLKRLSPL